MKSAIVTTRTLTNQWGENFASVSQNLIQYLNWAGYSSIILSKFSVSSLSSVIPLFSPDLVVLSGGETLGEDLERDKFEFAFLDLLKDSGVPTLGICRGMQVIGRYFDQDLVQVANHAGTTHEISGIVTKEVNSYHNFGFKRVVEPLEPLAIATDGTIESFRHRSLPILGVMWHPERDKPENWDNVLRFIL